VSGGGGGKRPTPSVTTITYKYFISLAIALGEGEIDRIGRIWADGEEIDQSDLKMTFYRGALDQDPDDLIASHEGIENTPAFRGVSYVVIEDLPLERFGNRIPQLNFEIFRQVAHNYRTEELVQDKIKAVCMIPGSGEYVYATTEVNYKKGIATTEPANAHSLRGGTNFENSLSDLRSDLPKCEMVSLVTSWFGDDLRCDQCQLQPKVEFKGNVTDVMPWTVGGLDRLSAEEVSSEDGNPIYGGTPTDASVIEAIEAIHEGGQGVFFYPFVLMDIPEDNGLADPYSGNDNQPKLPWRGRITGSIAPGRSNTPDKTDDVIAEVDAFFGTAEASDFTISNGQVSYSGPSEWSYRRFILHYAYLCVAAGGVEAFAIGSEMRGLTTLRDGSNNFPAVQHLMHLAEDLRGILGPDTKIGYAADWSEYFGYQPPDGSGDVFFHLDDLWSHADIDFIGIDNYMPLSDWRDTAEHLDDAFSDIYDQNYLKSNIEGGEGYDWYYATEFDREIQNRSLISDGAYGQDWIYRYKDIRNWWHNQHHNRLGGAQSSTPTSWEPRSKPIWFTEIGFGAVDKSTNQPNVFIDPKSSESAIPYFSTGKHDTQIQMSALRAVLEYWKNEENNPISDVYGEKMIDCARIFIWAWDARPWPDFPYRDTIWSDGENYRLGHWINGRANSVELSQIVSEICGIAGVSDIQSSELKRMVRGFLVSRGQAPRQSLEDLMQPYNFSAIEKGGEIVFDFLKSEPHLSISTEWLVDGSDATKGLEATRQSAVDLPSVAKYSFWDADDDYEVAHQEAYGFSDASAAKISFQVPVVLERTEGNMLAYAALDAAQANIETIKFSLPNSANLDVGDIVDLTDSTGPARYQILDVERGLYQTYQAERIAQQQTEPTPIDYQFGALTVAHSTAPIVSYLMDLPIFSNTIPDGDVVFAADATPWQGAAVYLTGVDGSFDPQLATGTRTILGRSLSVVPSVDPHLFAPVSFDIEISSGVLASVTKEAILEGANLLAIRAFEDTEWELIQFRYAELQASGTYRLSNILRGQAGTEHLTDADIPAGAEIVILNPNNAHFHISDEKVNIEQSFRVGPSNAAVSSEVFVERAFTYQRIATRPFRPCHLKAKFNDGDVELSWIRRARGQSDVWNTAEIPLNEAQERYEIRILIAGAQRRHWTVTSPATTYSAVDQSADGVNGEFEIEVSQISETFGAGPALRKTIYV
ncbi:MAG: glycoside hydrolase/phage tail family protein, partial [Pseudomonadota bacterium]